MKLIDLFEQQKVIEGNVELAFNIKKLDYYGVTVTGNFHCYGTEIKSLEGAPTHVDGDFDTSNTAIKSLLGAPSYVGGNLYCHITYINTLHNIHKQIRYIGGTLRIPRVQSHILGIMFIKGLKHVSLWGAGVGQLSQAIDIINKYLKGSRNPHECQEELIEAGLSEYAKL